MLYFCLGYLAFWVLLFSYLLKLNRQYHALQKEIDQLKSTQN